ncbi:hypothetical protein Y032_0033g2730 [Ancylostoma ceylanicum]|uniref:Uncharacterized protein n=1 Tax=Ancylostoma ceylanicum TaxID=53326 RepID=A0A016UQ38_9BILA|nr:hypothetical protein Y032_0033g2730 [Ancylostoma ceylanicum]
MYPHADKRLPFQIFDRTQQRIKLELDEAITQGPEYVQLVWNFRALSRADTLALTELGDEIPPMIYEYPIILAALLTLDSQSSSDSTLVRKFFTVEMESYSPMQYNFLPFLLDQLLHDSQPP